MNQMSTATGIDTCAYSSLLRASGNPGNLIPMNTPSKMHIATHAVRYLSKKPSPPLSFRPTALASGVVILFTPTVLKLPIHVVLPCYSHTDHNSDLHTDRTQETLRGPEPSLAPPKEHLKVMRDLVFALILNRSSGILRIDLSQDRVDYELLWGYSVFCSVMHPNPTVHTISA